MDGPNPRYPVPEHVSPEARAFLARPVDTSAAGIPADLHVYDAMWHGFPLMVPVEGRARSPRSRRTRHTEARPIAKRGDRGRGRRLG